MKGAIAKFDFLSGTESSVTSLNWPLALHRGLQNIRDDVSAHGRLCPNKRYAA